MNITSYACPYNSSALKEGTVAILPMWAPSWCTLPWLGIIFHQYSVSSASKWTSQKPCRWPQRSWGWQRKIKMLRCVWQYFTLNNNDVRLFSISMNKYSVHFCPFTTFISGLSSVLMRYTFMLHQNHRSIDVCMTSWQCLPSILMHKLLYCWYAIHQLILSGLQVPHNQFHFIMQMSGARALSSDYFMVDPLSGVISLKRSLLDDVTRTRQFNVSVLRYFLYSNCNNVQFTVNIYNS